MAETRVIPPKAPPPSPAAAALLAKLPTSLNQRTIAALKIEERLALYTLTLDAFLQERKKTETPEEVENYRYGNFFADLHGPAGQHGQLVKEYAERIISEGWEPVWWFAPLPRDVNAGGLDVERVVSVRLRARRLRSDVTLRRAA